MKSDSNGDIHLAHIEPKIRSLEPLTYQRIAIVFQPTAWAGPAHTKTNRRCVDRLKALEMCSLGMSASENHLWPIIQSHDEILETSSVR